MAGAAFIERREGAGAFGKRPGKKIAHGVLSGAGAGPKKSRDKAESGAGNVEKGCSGLGSPPPVEGGGEHVRFSCLVVFSL